MDTTHSHGCTVDAPLTLCGLFINFICDFKYCTCGFVIVTMQRQWKELEELIGSWQFEHRIDKYAGGWFLYLRA